MENKIGSKIFLAEIFFGSKKMLAEKKFGSKIFVAEKKFGSIFFWPHHLVEYYLVCLPKISFLGTLEVVKICRDWFRVFGFWVYQNR